MCCKPTRPYEMVTADIFHHAGYQYLVMADRFSGWPSIARLGRSADSAQVIKHLRSWFMDKGVPVKLTTDGGPQFKSQEFSLWCQKWGIDHDRSSPHYHQSNGHAEAAVKAMKAVVAKSTVNGNLETDQFVEAVLEFRNTPRSDGRSPAQILFGRSMRSRVPAHFSTFAKCWKEESEAADKRSDKLRAKARERYDANAKTLPPFQVGDIVRIQNPQTKKWDKIGEIVGSARRSRSYIVKLESGRVYWRNRRFLRKLVARQSGESETRTTRPDPPQQTPPKQLVRRSERPRREPDRYGVRASP